MAVKSLAVCALLLISSSMAAFNKVGNGVVRIELTKHYQPHYDIEDIEEKAEEDDQIQIEIADYQQLRNAQNQKIGSSLAKMRQKNAPTLLQQGEESLQETELNIDTMSDIAVDSNIELGAQVKAHE